MEFDPTVESELISAQLNRILSSRHFRNSRRCQSLLRYVVETAQAGRLDDLKERVVGTSVFGREPGYDTNEDAVVRNAAAEVRKRLAQYYLESEHESDLRIELPPGSYFPEIRPIQPHERQAVRPAESKRHYAWLYVAAALALVAAVTFAVFRYSPSQTSSRTDLDRFWAPIIATPGIVQLCVGQTKSHYYAGKMPEPQPNGRAVVPASELVPMRDRFIYFGDAICMSRLGGYLYSKGKEFTVRGAANTSYSDLRGRPAVLIGAFNNQWTIRLTQGLRFSLGEVDDPLTRSVLDKQNPGPTPWKMSRTGPGWDAEEDYAIVTRIFDQNTEQWVVSAGGISHFGTMMAGEFLANPIYFRSALASAPKDWARKNMQIVLSTKIVGETPGPPKVLATHFW